jgi:hypothetical protein
VRAKKEQSIAALQQELKQLEKESQELQIKIKDMNVKLQELKGYQISDTDSNFSYTCNETIEISPMFTKTSSKMPSFMRPTVCSQRKSGISHQISLPNRNKKPPVPRKKRPASVYAESLISPVKKFTCKSDCISECSISTSEYEVKQVIFPEEEKSPINGNSVEGKRIERWLNVQASEASGIYNQRCKRVMSTPFEIWSNNDVDENSNDAIVKLHEQDMDFKAEKFKQRINNKACFEENDIEIALPVPVITKYHQQEKSENESRIDVSVTEIFLDCNEEMLRRERKDREFEMNETKLDTKIGNVSNLACSALSIQFNFFNWYLVFFR